MNKYAAGLLAAMAAASTGFVVHVATQEGIQTWVVSQMQGRPVMASWDVRYLAFVTSLEMGVGLTVLYALIRRSLPGNSSLVRGLLLAALVLAVTGRLIRQPLMDLAIGNPLAVVAVQDGISWIVWLLTCIVLTLVYDRLAPRSAP